MTDLSKAHNRDNKISKRQKARNDSFLDRAKKQEEKRRSMRIKRRRSQKEEQLVEGE